MNQAQYMQVLNINSENDDLGYHLRVIVEDIIDGVHEYISRCLAYIQHSETKMYEDYIVDRLRDIGITESDAVVECTYKHTMDQIAVSVRCYVDEWEATEFVSIDKAIDKTEEFEPVFSKVGDEWFNNGTK